MTLCKGAFDGCSKMRGNFLRRSPPLLLSTSPLPNVQIGSRSGTFLSVSSPSQSINNPLTLFTHRDCPKGFSVSTPLFNTRHSNNLIGENMYFRPSFKANQGETKRCLMFQQTLSLSTGSHHSLLVSSPSSSAFSFAAFSSYSTLSSCPFFCSSSSKAAFFSSSAVSSPSPSSSSSSTAVTGMKSVSPSSSASPQVFTDYVSNYRKSAVPHTGRLDRSERWPYNVTWPEGYRGNHNYYGVVGFFRAVFDNRPEWGGQFYYLKRGLIAGAKFMGCIILLFYIVDPYGIKTVKARIRAKEAQA